MKTIKLILPLLAVCILYSSCGPEHSLSFTKRRYNHGYYVDRGTAHPKQNKAEYNALLPAAPAKSLPDAVADETTLASAAGLESKDQPEATELKKSGSKKSGDFQVSKPLHIPSFQHMHFPAVLPDAKSAFHNPVGFFHPKSKALYHDEDGGHSLLWIVCVVLLILWLIAILTGDWGLGGVIHVLLIIALILFILWLLRIL